MAVGLTYEEWMRCRPDLAHEHPDHPSRRAEKAERAKAHAALAKRHPECRPEPGRCEFTVPDWLPTPLNQLLGNPFRAGRLKRSDQEIVLFYGRHLQVPLAYYKRRVDLIITLPKGKRRPDKDCWEKSSLDALVAADLLINDSPVWCERGSVDYERGNTSTRFVLTDLP